MAFQIDMDGVAMGGSNSPVPPGRYNLRIIEATEKISKNGDPMVVVNYEVMDGPYIGRHVKFHYIVFFKDKAAPGVGMSKSFLKNIGQPFEGQITVDPNKWIGAVVSAKVIHEKGTDGNDYARVKFTDKYIVDFTAKTKAVDEEDPFGVEVE